jgi:hypothetical protein
MNTRSERVIKRIDTPPKKRKLKPNNSLRSQEKDLWLIGTLNNKFCDNKPATNIVVLRNLSFSTIIQRHPIDTAINKCIDKVTLPFCKNAGVEVLNRKNIKRKIFRLRQEYYSLVKDRGLKGEKYEKEVKRFQSKLSHSFFIPSPTSENNKR